MKVTMPDPMRADPGHAVYGLYDGHGLFYIGCSGLLHERLATHQRTHGEHVTAKVLATFLSRGDALAYERQLIARHRPRLNQQANPDYYAKQPWRKSA